MILLGSRRFLAASFLEAILPGSDTPLPALSVFHLTFLKGSDFVESCQTGPCVDCYLLKEGVKTTVTCMKHEGANFVPGLEMDR